MISCDQGRARQLRLLIGGILIAASGGWTVAQSWPSAYLATSLTLLACLCIFVFQRRALGNAPIAQRWLSPGYVFATVWLILFVVRPILVPDEISLRRTYYVADSLNAARWLGFIAAACFLVGLVIAHSRPGPSDRRTSAAPTRQWRVYAFGLVGVFGLALQFGKGLGGDTAYFYYLPLLIVGSSNALFAVWHNRCEPAPWYQKWAVLLAVVAFSAHFVVIGQRAFVLFAVSLAVPSLLRSRGIKSRLATLLLGIIVVSSLSALLSWRTSGSFSGGLRAEALEETFGGATTEMLPSLALLVQTEGVYWAERPGRLPATVLVQWVPRRIWPEKPVGYAEDVYSQAFPVHYANSRANTQFTLVGDFLTDSGAMGVAIGFILIGWLMASLARRRLYSDDEPGYDWAFVPILFALALRGDIGLILGIAGFLYLPLLAVSYRPVAP